MFNLPFVWPIDPNSPFAKLAALKEQLTANRKDQR